ncbi:MAG: hypothetical protein LBT64_02640 [Puniceicoccales bacterium]|jgi:hypothetical protein|nr:hypothetical protein [Puniceicoccales bacterium]
MMEQYVEGYTGVGHLFGDVDGTGKMDVYGYQTDDTGTTEIYGYQTPQPDNSQHIKNVNDFRAQQFKCAHIQNKTVQNALAVRSASEVECEVVHKRRKLSKHAAENVRKIKILQICTGFGLLGIGVGCAIGGHFIPNDGDTVTEMGVSMSSFGIGILACAFKETAIDAAKRPVDEQ